MDASILKVAGLAAKLNADVKTAYADALTADEAIPLADDDLAIARETTRLAAQAHADGRAEELDPSLARADELRLGLAVQEAYLERDRAYRRVAALLSLPGDPPLLLTDSLEMGALTTTGYPVPQAAAAALQAGADLLCISHGFEIQREAHQEVVRRVRGGDIPESRLDEAVWRVLAAKERFGILDMPDPRGAAPTVTAGTPATRELARALAAAAVTVVRDEAGLLPISCDRSVVVDVPPWRRWEKIGTSTIG